MISDGCGVINEFLLCVWGMGGVVVGCEITKNLLGLWLVSTLLEVAPAIGAFAICENAFAFNCCVFGGGVAACPATARAAVLSIMVSTFCRR